MEQDCIAGLYRSLGVSVGAEFSSEDVRLLYHKVFRVPSDTDEAHVAMKKIAEVDNSWSCVGENVLDVLLEMEREREKKEKLYWDLQLLNVGNLNTLYVMDKPAIIDPYVLNCLHQSTDPNTFKKAHNQSESGSLQSCTIDTGSLQRERLVGRKEQYGSVKRLKKAARQCWARLASEGAQSVLPSPWQGQSLGVRGQAWGCVSLSDVLLLVVVKYDVVTHLLYTEMLQEHYTLSIWETLMPWQQHKEEEGLEDLAEEALESGDMLRLAELPGAFRIYRACLGASFRSRLESREQSWSAVSLLCELHTFRQQERDTLTVLGKRLDRESLRLLCLCIRLATLRAQREKMSYSALLAARQSWETWPHVKSPCRAEQAALWLHGEEEEQKKDFISVSPQQAVLQLLVLTQEQERKHLVKLVHGISLEDLQEPGCTVPPKEDNHTQAALRNSCIKRLRQIQADLQTHNETQIPLKQTNPKPQLQPQPQPQPQMQVHISRQPAMWSQHQLEDCSLLLLTHLMELQEVQASALLSALMDKSVQGVQALRHEYESELQAQRYTNPLQLLVSDSPLTSGSILTPFPNLTDNRSNEQITAQSCCSGPVKAQNSSGGPAGAPRVDSIRRASRELNGVQAADGVDKQDVCTGCGVAMEDLPYLEILCVSDAASNTHQSLAAEGGAQEEEEGSAPKSPQSYEKQGSLIAVAWSKPPEDDTDYEAEAAVGGTGQSQDAESSLKTQVQTSDMSSTGGHAECEETSGEREREDLFLSASTGQPDAQSADQQCNIVGQLTLEERATADQPEKGKAVSHCDLQTHALVAETLQAVQPLNLLVDPPEIKRYAGLTNENVEREVVEMEMCPTATESEPWDQRGPEPAHAEDQKYNSQATVDCSPAERESTLMERERATEPISAVERERTMRNLVDMQRKVEQRQQRDRERQLLRVQERLLIIQNRKAEEDLLGLKHTDRLRHLTQDLPQEDKNQQKTVVKERLEQLRRERSYVMQSKRDRNTAGFKELLGPVALHSRETDDGAD
ncbi:uncharacterized protein LOC122875507 isoform X2 [Siniperca chuatsi]|uniref:uncharacterized protein LOC122875507 isoform X2 n=1 Tax=Siniperca chuatsi TaxID=119488 RepID=UPI001CE0F883|nr:uncharacterized protein LOC122875507 isoform X2 [Siniperca chuatsi]